MAEENSAASTAAEPVVGRGPAEEPEKKEEATEEPTGEAAKDDEKPAAEGESTTKAEEPSAPAESKEEDGDADSKAAAEPEANGAPASAKKAANGKRKSTGGNQKLSRKKSQHRVTHLDAKPGEYYLARLKSYPPWPAIICDEEMLPQTLLNTRPVTTKQADGTYKEPYADGGKRMHERTFPIMFLETNEFAWIPNTDLTPLDPESCKDVSEKGKQKQLIAAYKVAAENHDLQYFKDLLADHQRAIQQEAEDREAKEAAKAAAKAEKEQKKKKRKSAEVAEEPEDVEMAEAGEEEGKKATKATKKRKKDAESEAEAEKPAKTPKTATKLKLTTPKTPASETKKPAGKAKEAKGKAADTKKGAKAATSDEDTAVETPKEPEKVIDPEEARKKKEKEILFIRHKLQKGFISREYPPKEEEMEAMATFITKLEGHDDLEVSIIRSTKIHRVLRMIAKLNSIPKDEEYNFRRRSIDLLAKWKNLLDSDLPADEKEKEKESEPTTNGVHKETEEASEATEKIEKAADKEPEENKKAEETAEKAEKEVTSELKDEEMPDVEAEEKKQDEEPAKEASKEDGAEEPTEKTDEKADEKADDKAAEKPAEETAA
ncbi:hypothetical protein DTO212C5_1516 [Paecilomyces variotii]|nr:hypothetical protein DTO212C5_1516 [Paecilomyces variotii]